MKKIILSSILCLGLLAPVMAQETVNADPTVNKRGIALLPKAGDFALGIDAVPIASLVNLFGNGSMASFDGFNNSIYGKYFLKDNQAIRVKLSLDFTQNKFKNTVADDYQLLVNPSNLSATTVDVHKVNNQYVGLDLGYEFRRGRGRVQGFYGAQVNFAYGRTNNVYSYGNALTETNTSPSAGNFGTDNIGTGVKQGYRVLENKTGAYFAAGVGGFVGVEYFIAPQFSIGGELGLDFIYAIKGQNEVKTEGYLNGDRQEYQYRERTDEGIDNYGNYFGKPSFSTGISTRTSGAIFLMFHF